MGTWHDLNVGRPIAAPLEQCAELLGVDLATVRELAAKVEPYIRADGASIWSLMQLERQLRPEAYGRRRGGYLDRRRIPAANAESIQASALRAGRELLRPFGRAVVCLAAPRRPRRARRVPLYRRASTRALDVAHEDLEVGAGEHAAPARRHEAMLAEA